LAAHRPTIAGVAWFLDGTRVAILRGAPELPTDRKVPAGYDPNKRELAIVSIAAGGAAPVARALVVAGTPSIAASDDRILVTGATTQLFDAAGAPIAPPAPLPDHATRASYAAGVFVVVGADGTITLVDPKAGAIVTTWAAPDTIDAVAIPHGVVALDLHGTVRVGCLASGAIKPVAEASAGAAATRVQVVGDRLVVAADGPDPIRVAAFAPPCR
jgi:hypothetical protein